MNQSVIIIAIIIFNFHNKKKINVFQEFASVVTQPNILEDIANYN